MNLCLVLQQSRPVLFLKLFLSENHLDIPSSVICLAFSDIDLRKEIEVEVIGGFLRLGGSSKSEASGLEIKLHGFGSNVGHRDGEINVVFGGIGA